MDSLYDIVVGQGGVDETSANLLVRFAGLLEKWNVVYRLVGSVDAKTLYDKHIYDAIMLSQILQEGDSIVDLGAGAGLPSIPLRILRPDLTVILVEPQLKRINFCEQVRRELGLDGLKIIRGRAEEVVEQVGACRWVISRATWKLSEFLEIAQQYPNMGTRIVALKGADWEGELGSFPRPIQIVPYQTPFSGSSRNLLVFRFT